VINLKLYDRIKLVGIGGTMKKIIIFLFIALLPITTMALTKEDYVQNKYSKVMELNMPEGYYSFQGFIITNKYFVFSSIKKDESETKLLVYDINTLKPITLDASLKYNFGHSNDMAYNSKTDEIYVVNGKKIHVIDGKDFKEKKILEAPIEITSIAYDNESEEFYFRYMFKGYKYNSKFEKQFEFNMPTNLTRQSFSLQGDHIYYSCYEFGMANSFQNSYDGILEAGANLIYIYNKNGTLENGIYIPAGYGELEAMEFDSKGIPYLFFNTEDGHGTLYTPQYESYSESFSVKDNTSVVNAVAELANENGVIETVSLKKGTYDFKPIVFNEPGIYKYTITRFDEDEEEELKERKVLNNTINVVSTVYYDALTNQLNVETKYDYQEYNEEKEPPKDIENDKMNGSQTIDTNIKPGNSSNEIESESIENPQTGSIIPSYIIPIFLGVLTCIVLYKKKIFFRI